MVDRGKLDGLSEKVVSELVSLEMMPRSKKMTPASTRLTIEVHALGAFLGPKLLRANIYITLYTYIYIYMYMYTNLNRERERQTKEKGKEVQRLMKCRHRPCCCTCLRNMDR